jgi:hypothetical protein
MTSACQRIKPSQPDRIMDRAVAKYLLQQNEVGLHKYGYAMRECIPRQGYQHSSKVTRTAVDSAIPRVRWGPGLEHCDALIWRAFLEATDRGPSMK